MFACVDECRSRDHVATRDVRQVWTNVRTPRCAVYRVTHHPRRGQKHLLSTLLRIGRRRIRALNLTLAPRVELFLRLCDNPERHARMLQAAVLRTLPAID